MAGSTGKPVRRFFDSDMKNAQKTFLFYNKFFQNLLLPRVLTLVVFCILIATLLFNTIFHLPLLQPSPSISGLP